MKEPFDLWHEDALLVDDHPDWFVLLDSNPIVWTVRGVRLFRPRFALFGLSLTSIRTRSEFAVAWQRWQTVELDLLMGKISNAAAAPGAPPWAQALHAVVVGDDRRATQLLMQMAQSPTEPAG